ncbi:hypothetical protein BDY17DRAFT_335266 [Neohortaea acidophila]|uniref:Uncharacterized protein n=1 Tax=Neohortaea acidophila TaxID=245834 RepID=A0A6A6PTP3_9PEZI|nr:uncharacterized protein BDY17DRAFT_335266 [Neohortaea acidophila]KAF2482833.1 hypothetical protein BDY17DRAFT_335266 [Neohortaea acidophila]
MRGRSEEVNQRWNTSPSSGGQTIVTYSHGQSRLLDVLPHLHGAEWTGRCHEKILSPFHSVVRLPRLPTAAHLPATLVNSLPEHAKSRAVRLSLRPNAELANVGVRPTPWASRSILTASVLSVKGMRSRAMAPRCQCSLYGTPFPTKGSSVQTLCGYVHPDVVDMVPGEAQQRHGEDRSGCHETSEGLKRDDLTGGQRVESFKSTSSPDTEEKTACD